MMSWADCQALNDEKILDWATGEPWAAAMATCPQDRDWHAEGDVWTHTRMVCAELHRLADWRQLPRPLQLRLLFTALFHDAGKPATTILDAESGRTRSPSHAAAGVVIARRVLRDLGCDLETREGICALVRYHGRPPYLLENPQPETEVVRLSWLVENRLLYLFCLADTRGRVSQDTSRAEDNLQLWKLAAEELDCFERPFAFRNEHARFLFYRQALSSLHYAPHAKFLCTMTIMSGVPGSGKDTYLARERADLPVVSLDAIRNELCVDATEDQGQVAQAAREKCRTFLRAGRDFAFNATNTSSRVRKRWIDLAYDYKARAEIVYVEPPLATIHERNQRRDRPVPRQVIEDLIEHLEPPTIAECHDLSFNPD